MRLNLNKKIEFFFKKFLLNEAFLLKRRLERSIKKRDEKELNLVRKLIKQGTDSIDVGVYRGVYSYEMSKYSKRVHSFEPNPIIFDYINKNLTKLNSNILLYNYALSNQNKNIKLRVPIRNKEYSKENFEEYYQMGLATIHGENNFKEFESFNIQSKKIDEIDFENLISFIKIDVEGHELEVIKGAEKIIKKNFPNLLVEIEKKHINKDVNSTINYVNSLGYNSFCYDNDILINTTQIKNLDLFNNFIFLPRGVDEKNFN